MMPKEMKARDFVSRGYVVEPAVNGGFIARTQREPHSMGEFAAFSNSQDLLSWIGQGHAEIEKESSK